MFEALLPIARAREIASTEAGSGEEGVDSALGFGDTGSATPGSEPRVTPDARIHALTLLHFLLADRATSRVAEPLVPRCLAAATLGFRSELWPVRNAALMLFASGTARFCGGKSTANEAGREGSAIGAAQPVTALFGASDELGSLLAEELELAADFDAAVRPSLQPVLLLLSRLRPADVDIEFELKAHTGSGGPGNKGSTGSQLAPSLLRYVSCVRSVAALVAHPAELARRAATRALAASTPARRFRAVSGFL